LLQPKFPLSLPSSSSPYSSLLTVNKASKSVHLLEEFWLDFLFAEEIDKAIFAKMQDQYVFFVFLC